MEFNLDELNAPEWMNKDFFTTVLRSSVTDGSVKVLELDISPATKPGDHFASIMFRVKVTYSTKTENNEKISLIIKIEPQEEGIKKEMLGNSPLFDIEMKMYSKTIPEIQRLLKSAGDDTIMAPKMLYCCNKPAKLIVFEDITIKQFEMTTTFLDLKASKIVFERLAKYHACTFYMEEDNQNLSSYDINFFNGKMGDVVKDFLSTNINDYSKLLETWDEFKQYKGKFESLRNNFVKNGNKLYTPNTKNSGGYNVLNHGDFHFKNMMFKKKDKEIEDVIFFDFQISFYASPGIDLIYALNCVGDSDCRSEHRLELIHLYYQTFVTTLKKIGFLGKIPTMLDLQIEILKCGFLEVITTICFIPFIYADFSKYTAEDLIGANNQELKEIVLKVPEVQKLLKSSIPEFILRGLFD